MKAIGILAVQGGFDLHAKMLEAMGHRAVLVRSPEALAKVEGLVLPGGESTAQLWGIERLGLSAPLASFLASGRPVLATCAGLILLASHVRGLSSEARNETKSLDAGRPDLLPPGTARLPSDLGGRRLQRSFAAIEAEVVRNGWGPQVDSFEATDDAGTGRLVFIRAPRIVWTGDRVERVRTLHGEPVLIRQGAITATTYHPELTNDTSTHREVFGSPAISLKNRP